MLGDGGIEMRDKGGTYIALPVLSSSALLLGRLFSVKPLVDGENSVGRFPFSFVRCEFMF